MPAGPAPSTATRPEREEDGTIGTSGRSARKVSAGYNLSETVAPVIVLSTTEGEDAAVDAELEVRPPKQERSRASWNRVLDAGVAILEDTGYDALTIAAVCER